MQFPIEDLLIPPSAYLTDRTKVSDIDVPYASGKRAFGVHKPLPLSSSDEGSPRLPRVLRETSSFLMTGSVATTEGLFRVSARQQTVEVLKEAYDRGQKYIVWCEGSTVLACSHHKEGYGDVAIDPEELSDRDGYDVHTAAALIKLWYKELREPIFPQSSYQALEKIYGDPQTTFGKTMLLRILDPGVEYSPLPELPREILKRHLLPLLSNVSSDSEGNKMTASNLAVCFAPILLCGPDPLEDMKILPIIRRLLTAMIEHWEADLAPALGYTHPIFTASLRTPREIEDREDPLDEARPIPDTNQVSGITLLDNDNSRPSSSSSGDPSADDILRPPLPPRPRRAVTITAAGIQVENSTIHRKPAPPLHTPPRYSSLVPSEQAMAALSGVQRARTQPTGTVEVLDEEDESLDEREASIRPSRPSIDTLPAYEEHSAQQAAGGRDDEIIDRTMSIPRKPVGEGKG